MYCTNCGTEIADDAKFCPFCGKPTVSSSRSQIQLTQPTQPTQIPFEATPYTPAKSKTNTAIAVVLVIIVGVIIIYFGIWVNILVPNIGITLFIIGAIMICCIGLTVYGSGKRRGRSYGGGGGWDCSGCDCGDCDCGS